LAQQYANDHKVLDGDGGNRSYTAALSGPLISRRSWRDGCKEFFPRLFLALAAFAAATHAPGAPAQGRASAITFGITKRHGPSAIPH